MEDKDKIIEAAARFAQNGSNQPQQPQVVPPHPSPMSVQLSGAQGSDGKKYVLLIIHHATGQSVFHFEPDGADRIAQGMIDAARVARTGLEIPKM